MVGACDVQSHSNVLCQAKLEASIYLQTPRENIAHCFPLGDVALFDLYCDTIAAFLGSSVSDWTVALNTWNTTRDLEDARRR